MPLIYGGTTVKKLIYNGTTCKKGIYNGTQVFNSEYVVFPDASRSWSAYEPGRNGNDTACVNHKNEQGALSGTNIHLYSHWYNSYDDVAYAYTTVNLTGYDTLSFSFTAWNGPHGSSDRYNQCGIEIANGPSSMHTITANGTYSYSMNIAAYSGNYQVRFRMNYSFGGPNFTLNSIKLT